MLRKLITVVALVGALALSGCEMFNPIGPIIQIGIMWKQGEATKYYNTDQATLLKATKDALTELDLPVTREEADGHTVYLRAGTDDRFKVKVTHVNNKVSKLSIRVNVMGDKPFAELVFRHVDGKPGVRQFVSVEELNCAVEDQPPRKVGNRLHRK